MFDRMAIAAFGLLLMISSLAVGQGKFVNREIRTRVDYRSGLVFYEEWVEGVYSRVVQVESLDTHLARRQRQALVQSWQEVTEKKRLSEELAFDRDGLIPEIVLPALPLFGTGSKIDISGSDRITFGGRQSTYTGLPGSAESQSWLPELTMNQALRINLNGTIGDKTKVFLDHDSERQFEGKNKIRLNYQGTEDEIIQSVEAGDTRLVIPSTGYTGDLPAHKGLFGISARGKLGGIDLYGVAAREQSESQTREFRQRKQMRRDTIYDKEFLRNTRFRLDTLSRLQIRELRVWVDDGNPYNNTSTQRCIATVRPDFPESLFTHYEGDRRGGEFDLKQPNTDYIVPADNSYIEFTQPLMSNYAVGVSYKLIRGTDTLNVGGYKWRGDSIVLKLIKPTSAHPASRTWDLEVKNIYSLGARDVRLDSIRLYRKAPGEANPTLVDTNGMTFLQLVGLDPEARGTVSWPRFDSRNGYLICDSLRPFIARSLSIPDSIYHLYDLTNVVPKYYFVIDYSTAKESYNLGVTDILENSEKVYVNGQLWTVAAGQYTINYATGELTFKQALPPDADIRITYEYLPFFSVSQKSVVGTRAEGKFLERGRIGSSIFYRTEEMAGDDKPSLGAEPFQRTVAETDFSYDVNSDFITSLLDRLPLLRADAPTTFRIGGEGAVSLPNPNTRNVAYLDDFEGSTISRDAGNRYRLWQYASVPVDKDTGSFARTRLIWYNPVTRIPKESIFGDIGEEKRDLVDYLRIRFTPDDQNSWAGIMTCPSRLGMNVADLENIEAVLRTRQTSGRIHITLGTSIDEDAPRRRPDGTIAGYNGREDTEDRNRNGILDDVEGEDTGLDGVPGPDNVFPAIPDDDGNDDYNAKNPDNDLTANPNGTEGNRILDGEDLMGSGWTRSNHYYEYTFSLQDTVVVKPLVRDWKTLRISLRDPVRSRIVGSPRFEEIRLIRIWFDSFPGPDTIDLYSLAIVGSRWRNPRVESTPGSQPVDTLGERIRVSLISKKTDAGYQPPFEPKKDALGRTELEASLKFTYENIKPGHRGVVSKTNPDREDYRDYQGLHIYVHSVAHNPDFFIRVGADSLNYYEYRQPIMSAYPVPGRPNWYEVRIRLDTFPAIKRHIIDSLGSRRDTLTRLANFALSGNPSLADVRYLAMGIENTAPGSITGDIWIDDIRLTGPRKDAGLGFTSSFSIRLSDLANLNFNYRYEDPNFRRFSEGRGVKTGGYGHTLGYGLDVSLDRFFPASWGLSLPLNYSVSRGRSTPKFASAYPDLRLPSDLADDELGGGESRSWSFSVRKNRSANRLMNYTLEALNYSFRHTEGANRSLLDRGSSVSNYHSVSYGISPDLKFKLGSSEISYFPQSIRLSGRLGNSKSPRFHRDSANAAWIALPSDSSSAAGYDFSLDYSPVSDLSFNYSLSADRDLLDENLFNNINIGQESGRDGTFGASYSLDIGEFLSPRIDFDGHYSEDRLRWRNRYDTTRNVSNGSSIDLSTDLDLPELLGMLGKLRNKAQDKEAKPGSPQWLLRQLENSQNVLSGIDLNYSFDRSSNYSEIARRPPIWYQLGFTDALPLDSAHLPSVINREMGTDFGASTSLRFKNLDVRLRYGRSWERDVTGSSPTGNINTSWPDIALSLSRVEGLFPKLLSNSSFSSNYVLRSDFTGSYVPGTDSFEAINRRIANSVSYSPLISWQATWKNKVNTTFSTNYTVSDNFYYLEPNRASRTKSENRSYSFNLGYSFSAPSGIKLFGLRRLKFTSDLGVNFGFTYGRSRTANIPLQGEIFYTNNNEDIGTTLSLSYRFSRSIEAGLNSGYSIHRNLQGVNVSTRTTDLNFWVLFKF